MEITKINEPDLTAQWFIEFLKRNQIFYYVSNVSCIDDEQLLKDALAWELDGYNFYLRDLIQVVFDFFIYDGHPMECVDFAVWNRMEDGGYIWHITDYLPESEYLEVKQRIREYEIRRTEFLQYKETYPYKRNVANAFLYKNRKRLLKKLGGRCVYCGAERDLCIDHIKPVRLGGNNVDNNLQVLCRRCNSSKGCNYE